MATPISESVPTKLLGARIRRARKAAGLSHDSLGAVVGASRGHLIRLEQGLHRPQDSLLERIAEATGEPLSFFVRKPTLKPRVAHELTADDREKLANATAPLAAALLEIVREKLAVLEIDLEEVDAA